MTLLLEPNEQPGFRLIDASDVIILKKAINQLYQGTVNVRVPTTSPVTVVSTDFYIIVRLAIPGPVTVNLPSPIINSVVVIKDGTGDASTNNITINGAIDGGVSFTIAKNHDAVTLVGDGSNWNIV